MDTHKDNRLFSKKHWVMGILTVITLFIAGLCFQTALSWRGKYRHVTSVTDLDSDGDLDIIHGHTRWEDPSSSFAGVTLWINQGTWGFVVQEKNVYDGLFSGFAAGSGDVDQDGDTDLMILDGYELSIIVNQGNAQDGQIGMYSNPTRFSAPIRFWGHADMGGSVLSGDLNGDLVTDAFIVNCCYGDTGAVELKGNHLEPSVQWVSLISRDDHDRLVANSLHIKDLDMLPVRSAALGDVDSDGDLDAYIAIGQPTAGDSLDLADRVFLNDGMGNFTDSGQRLGDLDSYAVALGDLDADGDLDALVGTKSDARIWINQEGVFEASKQTIKNTGITAVFLEDFDQDGDLDALLAGDRLARLWWNDGNGNFIRSSQRFFYTDLYGIAVADFDGDGFVDIFAGSDTGKYKFWSNQRDATFIKIRQGNRISPNSKY